ncbi:hypothetical protein RFI_24475 [Reticulomyxa filosa]|uniref:Uncharacterized protein n=1 Tax=Reticulomyxa filosa TaxID=46433 RepID=X6MH01_RETFI|nr:hypothetical protein RFI_24475 [Reticulomyxa filosa]|eukprot:ETO12901.1 hypothetical protein RFI_24475 [Reticulomyxa filosa]
MVLLWHLAHMHHELTAQEKKTQPLEHQNEQDKTKTNETENKSEQNANTTDDNNKDTALLPFSSSSPFDERLLETVRQALIHKLLDKQNAQTISEALGHCYLHVHSLLIAEQKKRQNSAISNSNGQSDLLTEISSPLHTQVETLLLTLPHVLLHLLENQTNPYLQVSLTNILYMYMYI